MQAHKCGGRLQAGVATQSRKCWRQDCGASRPVRRLLKANLSNLPTTPTSRPTLFSCQIPAGFLADAVGGERVILMGLVAWSLANAATPLAAQLHGEAALATLLLVRALFGVCQASGQPSVSAVCAR